MATSKITLAKGLNAGLRKAMEDDPKVLIMGEDVGKLGGVFRITDGLQKDFGEDRVIDSPLAESGIVGTAVGMALRGYRPVVEIQFDGFVYPAYDQIEVEAEQLGEHLRAGCKALPEPHILDVFDQVYAEGSPELDAQKAGYAAYLDSFDMTAGAH